MAQIRPYEQQVNVPLAEHRVIPHAVAPDALGDAATAHYLGILAEGIGQGAAGIKRRDEEGARAWSAGVMSDTRLQWEQYRLDKQSKVEPGAPDFTPDLLKEFDEYAGRTVERAPTPIAKAFIKQRLYEYKAHLGEAALNFEAQARIDYRSDSFKGAIGNTAKLMNTDPNQYGVALAEQLALIDSSNLPPIQKSAIREQAIRDVSSAAVWSQIHSSPETFLQSIGLKPGGRPLPSISEEGGKEARQRLAGDLQGRTGNLAFDALPHDKRVQFVESAYRLKASIDNDADKFAKDQRQQMSDDAMKEAFNRLEGGKLTRDYVETIRPLIRPEQYHSLIVSQRAGPTRKDDPNAYAEVEKLTYVNPIEAEKKAYQYHKAGLLKDESLSKMVERSRLIARQEGPKSEYERSRHFIIGSLDPGPMVHDPIARNRLAEALDTFDRWVNAVPNRPDKDIEYRGKEVVTQYRFVNLADTVMALPSPRSGNIRRNAGDMKGIQDDILAAHAKAKTSFENRTMTQREYDDEMAIMNRWRKALDDARRGETGG